ncbi:type II secretion system F family protein [Paenibacillus naphthalenovorans]|uniref:Type II secretion system protein n=1 Tax=Paenibacillus naphthalenovorans TaxID=162209 RepID=A0A0U2KZH3_9BACL|nr:type II secretion system F family protein [Paenibacillus naphthalenovorans]ALS22466.1 type II secretion system protein [Paenibacillus naphthalenovorans]
MWIAVLFVLELTAAFAALYMARPQYSSWVYEHRGTKPLDALSRILPAGLWVMDRTRLADRLTEPLGQVHLIMIQLHGAKKALIETKRFAAQAIVYSYGALCLSTLLGWAAGGQAEMLLYGLLLAAFIPFVMYKQISNQCQKRKRQMLIELPEVLNRILLLVSAGETVPQALIRSVEGKENRGSPLLTELAAAVQALKMNGSFSKVMEEFSKRCAMQETSLFTTALLMNHKRGGDELVMSLQELSITLWDKRKALARTLGEEGSSKLVFPMVLIFFVVMVIVAAPAMLMMN